MKKLLVLFVVAMLPATMSYAKKPVEKTPEKVESKTQTVEPAPASKERNRFREGNGMGLDMMASGSVRLFYKDAPPRREIIYLDSADTTKTIAWLLPTLFENSLTIEGFPTIEQQDALYDFLEANSEEAINSHFAKAARDTMPRHEYTADFKTPEGTIRAYRIVSEPWTYDENRSGKLTERQLDALEELTRTSERMGGDQ